MSDDAPEFRDLDLATRQDVATQRLAPIAARLGAQPVVEGDDPVRTLVLRGRTGAPREVTVAARLQHDDLVQVVASVDLHLALDNRMGTVELVHLIAGEEPDAETMTAVTRSTFVQDSDPAVRQEMETRLARLPPLVPIAERFLAEHDLYSLSIEPRYLKVCLGWLDDENAEELAAASDRFGELLDGLEKIASLIETLPPEGFVTCRYCGARVSAGLEGCSRCGASL